MQIQTYLSFISNSFSGEDYVKLLNLAVDFKIKKFSVDEIRDGELNFHEKYLSKIARCTSEAELMFRTNFSDETPNEQFWIMESAHRYSPQTLYWFLNDREPDLNLLMSLMTNKNFTTGYISDSDFLRWQNEKSIPNYEYFKKDHKQLPKIFDRDFEEWQIDIKKINPGRSKLVSHMWLQSSYKMFFGKHFFKFFDKDKVLAFPEAYSIVELENEVVFIQLFADITKSSTTESLTLMRRFREWINLDKIEMEL